MKLAGVYVDEFQFMGMVFRPASREVVITAYSTIPNATSAREVQLPWKQLIARHARAHRGPEPWDPTNHYAISVAFNFHSMNHGHQPYDPENYLKPILDGIAAGLFCSNAQDPRCIERFNYPDNMFKFVLFQDVEQSPDPLEGIAALVSTL